MEQKSFDLLSLSLIPGLGSTRTARLLRQVTEPAEFFSMTRADLRALGLSTDIQFYILGGWARKDAETALKAASERGIEILTRLDAGYPPLLGQIFDPPLVLYALGDTAILSKPAIAVVGSRRCSVYGSEVAYTLGRDLVRRGMVVVSGMALGIDGKAHQGALSGSGETVAVLGTGVDVVYPRSHRKLYQQIRETGCVVSECPLGAFPAPQNFPIRNRIISGLSVGTVIPEASEFSGSLITARLTLEQDRELWAVPGNITNPGSYGPNHLIKQGARPLLDVQDVLEGLPVHILNALERKLDEETDRQQPDPVEEEILRMLLVEEAEPFDRLLVRSGRNITDLSGILVSLEAKGLVRSLPGRRYCRRLVTVSSTKEERAPIRN